MSLSPSLNATRTWKLDSVYRFMIGIRTQVCGFAHRSFPKLYKTNNMLQVMGLKKAFWTICDGACWSRHSWTPLHVRVLLCNFSHFKNRTFNSAGTIWWTIPKIREIFTWLCGRRYCLVLKTCCTVLCHACLVQAQGSNLILPSWSHDLIPSVRTTPKIKNMQLLVTSGSCLFSSHSLFYISLYIPMQKPASYTFRKGAHTSRSSWRRRRRRRRRLGEDLKT